MSSYSDGKLAEISAALTPPPSVEALEGTRITVHAAVSRFAVLYEKIRNAVDYRDDHLLCKAAIVRILKRQLGLEHAAGAVALQLVRELIAARYLPNATLPESLVVEAAMVVRKYQALKKTRLIAERHLRWLLGIVAAELEELLCDHTREKALVNFLFEQLGDRITIRDVAMDEATRRLQVYIACHRSLFKADDEMLGYKLVRVYHEAWMRPAEWIETSAREMALQMVGVEQNVQAQLHDSRAQKFLAAVKPWGISLNILREALTEDDGKGMGLLQKPEELKKAAARIAERRYKESRGKLRRGTVRAIIYLFITKVLLALAIEIPFEKILFNAVDRMTLAINILFPPILMLIVGSLIRVPKRDNTERIERGVEELLSVEGPKGREIRLPASRGFFGNFFFRVGYALMFFVTFGLVFFFLGMLKFTWVSACIFLFFLCIVSFFAFRLRLAAREFVVVERPDRFSTVMIDFFTLPILRAGQWLSETVSRINIFIFFFDFIIETPFKLFLNILEDVFAFMKEKKEELQ